MTSALTEIGGIHQLGATLSNLGSQLSAAAPNGGFGDVLAQVNSELAAVNNGGSLPSTGSSSSSGLLGSSLVGASSTSSSAAGSQPTGQDVVADAAQYLGVPYVWGGTSTSGLDCSGLVQKVYGDLGISLPRTSEEQAQVGTPVASLADAQPGDLVFFAGSDGTASSPGHVGIYIGNGQMIDAPHTGTKVQVQAVGDPVSIRRILPASSFSDALSSVSGGSGSVLDLTSAGGAAGAAGLYGSGGSAGVVGSVGSVGAGDSGGSAGDSAGMTSLGVPAALQSLFEQAGQRYGVNPLLLASVAKQESGFQPNVVSSAGAIGLMQLMPATAAGLGVSASDPGQAIDGAAQLLSGYLGRYGGSVPLALAAYNAGPGAVSQYGGVPPYSETQSYVSNITSMLSQADAASGVTV
ncbi:MAG TPA: NlpC/P60 family protein [Acidimicrobiales bacterium]|nr:NlpC/P60 family protein [Acidimicrobiales bacterium]